MSYKSLTISERCCIYQFKLSGMNIRHLSTISRELKRNSYKTSIYCSITNYSPNKVQELANERKENSHANLKYDENTIEYIQSKLLDNWSPEQIAKRKTEEVQRVFHQLHQFIDIFIKDF